MSDLDLDTIFRFVSASGVIFAIVYAVKGGRRADRHDDAQSAKTLAEIETKLDTVQRGVENIQLDFKAQQRQLNDMSERVARVEESAKSAHRRIDEMKGE